VARGWESKAIEAQQEEASRRKPSKPLSAAGELIKQDRLRSLHLTRKRLLADLERARVAAHREMLEAAIAALDAQLAALGGS